MLQTWDPHWGKTLIKLTLKTFCFLATEYFLGAVGLDTLADYSEFMTNCADQVMLSQTATATLISDMSGQALGIGGLP